MIVRHLTLGDLEAIRKVHERDYQDMDFALDRSLLNGFVIEDDNGEFILAGGVEPIAEAILVTDKTKSRIKIGKALVEAQRVCMFTCGVFNIRELHAFVTDEQYMKHLIRHGFRERDEKVLRIIV